MPSVGNDRCSMCDHGFHGLTCQHKEELDSNYRFTIKEKCKCPGPFATPVLEEGPRTRPTKGIW